MPAVELRGVWKDYDGHSVLADVSLQVAAGEFLVLVGPSGCGKTSILRCIAGLEEPSRGEILVDGAVVNARPPAERDVAMVFQNYALYPHLTVRENIAFPLRMRGVARTEALERVAEAAETLGLSPLLERRPAQLSGGERQRTALARAMVRRPKAFLFDEPLSNLDAALRAGMRAELSALHRRLGATVLYVTHDQIEAMTLGRRIAVMRAGRIQQVGAPGEVYERPANRFVATFIGAPGMNLLPASALGRSDASWIGFRPEDARLVETDAAVLRGRVMLVEPLGAETLVHVGLADHEAVVVRVREGGVPALEETVGIAFAADRLHRFGAEEERLP